MRRFCAFGTSSAVTRYGPSGANVSNASAGPAGTMLICPAAAASGRPSTGDAMNFWPSLACTASTSRSACTPCVPIATWIAPFSSAPEISLTTSVSALSSLTMLITTSRPLHASAIEPATLAPFFSSSAAFSRERL